jgi:hypothetical protein
MNVQRKIDVAANERSIEDMMIAAVDRAALEEQPCEHIAMREVFDPDTYRTLLDALPDMTSFHDLRHRDALRPDGTSTRQRIYLYPEVVRSLPGHQRAVWTAVSKALTSKRLEQAFKAKFRKSLEARFGKKAEQISLYPVPILLRDQPGYRIGIHADVLTKAITVQFYLPTDEAQAHLGTIFHEAESGPGADKVTRMSFLPSSGYAFPVVGKKSWHSAATVQDADGERVSMMVTYYVTEKPKRWLLLRFRRALMRLGIFPQR